MKSKLEKVRWYPLITILYFILCVIGCIVAYVVYHHEPTNLIVVSMLMVGFFWIRDEIVEFKYSVISILKIKEFMEEYKYDQRHKIN